MVSPTPASPTSPTVIDVTDNDQDPDGSVDPASVSIAGGTDTDGDGFADELLAVGEGVWTVDSATGRITFTPEDGFTEDPTPISYTVDDDDSLTSNPAIVTIDYPPVASDDAASTGATGEPTTVDVLDNDTTGDVVDPTTVSLVGGTDTDSDGFDDERNTSPPARITLDAQFATVSGVLWNDVDGDGVQDLGEVGLPGVTVILTCSGPDGEFDTDDDTTRSTVTASPYSFTLVPIGESCRVSIATATLPPDVAQTFDPDGLLDATTNLVVTGDVGGIDFGFRTTRQTGSALTPTPTPPPQRSPAPIGIALTLIVLGSALLFGSRRRRRDRMSRS